ncbi:MAG TPA: ComEC/Rec2 family competence protein [Pyrinomonadaceae bacterium]|nr:ComEC/Rec2 family competence protein [Pyrinomonadaceae bacterium]
MAALSQGRTSNQPLLLIAVAIASGILLSHYFSNSTLAGISIIVALTCGVAPFRIYQRVVAMATAALALSFFCTGYVLAFVQGQRVAPDRIVTMFEEGRISLGEPLEVTGTIKGDRESAPDGFYLNLAVEAVRLRGKDQSASGTVILRGHIGDSSARTSYDDLQLHHGARIRVLTVLDRDDDYRNPGVMPFTEYLERKDYDATGVIKSPLLVERLDDAPVFLPLAWLYQWRTSLERKFDQRFSIETAGILDAVLLGNRHKISRQVADRFREGGTFHVLVIAGLHISFIAGLLFLLMRRLTRNRIVQFAAAVLLVFGYSVAVGAEAPVIRATLVFSLGIFAPLVSRRANSLNIISGGAIALLVWRPSDLFDPSFQLTFLSVISIVTLAVPIMLRMQQVGAWKPTHETPYPPACSRGFRVFSETLFWSERAWRSEMADSNIRYRLFKTPWAIRFERWHVQRPLRFALGAVVVTTSVQIGMLPLLIIYFHRVSFASLVLNIFVGATMAVLALIALAATLVAQVSSFAAAPLIWLSEKIEWLMVHSIDPITRLAFASLRLPHYHGKAGLVYSMYFIVLIFLVRTLAQWNPLRSPELVNASARRSRVKIALALFAMLLCVIVLHPFSSPPPDQKLHVDFLDVGQGDSALVTMPDGATLLIDGGGKPNIDWNRGEEADDEPFERDTRSIGERVVSEFLWARGLDRVDYILPTHADADHIDGLNDVARNFKVRGAIVARTPAGDSEYARFAQTMKAARVPIERIGAGDVLRFGDVAVEVLWPPPTDDANATSRNNDGVVLRIRYGDQSLLFTADIEKETEARIVNAGLDLRSEVVKVAHHGSRTSSTQPFIDSTRASLAVISVGRTSIFGHPHKEVAERWRASGATVRTTGEKGTISLATDGKQLAVSTFLP